MIVKKLNKGLIQSGIIFASIEPDVDSVEDVADFIEAQTNTEILVTDIVEKTTIPEQFKALHYHTDIEARYFIAGSGIFYINAGKKINKIICKAGDLLILPANVEHYFDVTKESYFKVVRFFTNSSGWEAFPVTSEK
jgi:cupin superfamily acireductone dioxygenase involved in methionine salvage